MDLFLVVAFQCLGFLFVPGVVGSMVSLWLVTKVSSYPFYPRGDVYTEHVCPQKVGGFPRETFPSVGLRTEAEKRQKHMS